MNMQLSPILVNTGLVSSPFQARQLLASGSVFVNGKKATRSSLQLAPNDLVSVDPSLAGCTLKGGKFSPYKQSRNSWRADYFAFSQTKALSVVILR